MLGTRVPHASRAAPLPTQQDRSPRGQAYSQSGTSPKRHVRYATCCASPAQAPTCRGEECQEGRSVDLEELRDCIDRPRAADPVVSHALCSGRGQEDDQRREHHAQQAPRQPSGPFGKRCTAATAGGGGRLLAPATTGGRAALTVITRQRLVTLPGGTKWGGLDPKNKPLKGAPEAVPK